MKHYTVDIPKTRDPFVNIKLIPAGIDRESGEERFWASTWNSVDGSTGALVTASGKNTIYRFNPNNEEYGFYGAAYAGNDTLWMTCFTDRLYQFNIATGKTIKYPTGVASGLTNSGLTYDEATGKVFYSAYCQQDYKRKGLVFDTKTERVIKVFDDIPIQNTQLRNSIKNPDGTYTYLLLIPGLQIIKWDPKDDSLEVLTDLIEIGEGDEFQNYICSIQRDDGAIFLPKLGWFDSLKKEFVEGPLPSLNLCWFGRDEQYAYGAQTHKLGNSVLYRWCFETGEITQLAEIPDITRYSFNLSRSGKIICINLYGFLYVVDKTTGAIEIAIRLETDARGHIDCTWRIDEDRLLCTPFITQRFYEIKLSTNQAVDLGRATGGVGEVLQVCEQNGTIYMASYTKGQMVAFDPAKPAHFPENPTIVCEPPAPAMRPVAMCKDDTSIYYSISHEYGLLGCMLTKYTKNNAARVVDNPIPNHMIRSLAYDQSLDMLLAGTTYQADCNSVPPVERQCKLALLDRNTLLPVRELCCGEGFDLVTVLGTLEAGKYLVTQTNLHQEYQHGSEFFLLDVNRFALTPYQLPSGLEKERIVRIYFTGREGLFVICNTDMIQLWDMNTGLKTLDIAPSFDFYNGRFQNNALYLISREKIHIFEGI